MIIFDKNWCKSTFKFMFNMGYLFEKKNDSICYHFQGIFCFQRQVPRYRRCSLVPKKCGGPARLQWSVITDILYNAPRTRGWGHSKPAHSDLSQQFLSSGDLPSTKPKPVHGTTVPRKRPPAE